MRNGGNKTLSRREFVRTAAASAGAVMLPSRGEGEAAVSRSASASSDGTQEPASASLAEGLSKELVMELLDATAKHYMDVSSNCAQASFLALQEVFGLDKGSIVKALTPLPGIAERGETCGAVTGPLMALGLVYGRDRLEDWQGWRDCLIPARKFCESFEQELGSTRCGEILEKLCARRYDLADPADLQEYRAAGGPEKCCGVVQTAVRMAAEILLERPKA